MLLDQSMDKAQKGEWIGETSGVGQDNAWFHAQPGCTGGISFAHAIIAILNVSVLDRHW